MQHGGVQPPGTTDPQHAEGDAGQGACPHHGQQHQLLTRGQQQYRQWGVRAGDDQEDVRVVQPPQDHLPVWTPRSAVVDRAGTEQQAGRQRVHRTGRHCRSRARSSDQDDAADQREGEHADVQPAAHPRLQRSRHALRPAFQGGALPGSQPAGCANRRINRGRPRGVGRGAGAGLGLPPVCRRLSIFGDHAFIF